MSKEMSAMDKPKTPEYLSWTTGWLLALGLAWLVLFVGCTQSVTTLVDYGTTKVRSYYREVLSDRFGIGLDEVENASIDKFAEMVSKDRDLARVLIKYHLEIENEIKKCVPSNNPFAVLGSRVLTFRSVSKCVHDTYADGFFAVFWPGILQGITLFGCALWFHRRWLTLRAKGDQEP